MHLIPSDRTDVRMIELDKVCAAIGALDDEVGAKAWARRFSLLGDLTRLRLLLCIKSAGPISVSDLTAAAGLNPDTVSQTLRFLRANQVVSAERDGRIIRYRLSDPVIDKVLDATVNGPPSGRVNSPPSGRVTRRRAGVSASSSDRDGARVPPSGPRC